MKKVLISLLCLIALPIYAAETDPHETDRKELRGILDDMVIALNAHDFDKAAIHLDPQGVVTYYNAEVTVGHEAGRKYFNRMLKDAAAIVKEYKLTGDVSAPAIFHGDTAIAYGVTKENFKLTEGLEFTLDGRWSATMQKKPDGWKIINLHFSANLFDNPLLNAAKNMQWIIGFVAFALGLLVMLVLMRFRKKG